VMTTSPPDFTELLQSTAAPLPALQKLHSQMAKVELEAVEKARGSPLSPCRWGLGTPYGA
jgi:hypothetical protein